MLIYLISYLHFLLLNVDGLLQYTYRSNISQNANPNISLGRIEGQITLLTYTLKNDEKNLGLFESDRIFYLRAHLTNSDRGWKRDLEGVAEFQSDGMLRQLRIPVDKNYKTTELNIFKGIISLFVLHTSLEAGEERDSSGACYASYALVDNAGSGDNEMVFDKFKRFCKPLNIPLDVWNRDLFPTKTLEPPKEMYIRYWFDKQHNHINRILAHEYLKHHPFPFSQEDDITVVSWQEASLVSSGGDSSGDTEWPVDMLNMAEKLLKTEALSMHLAPVFTLDSRKHACSLNGQLRMDSNDDPRQFHLSVLVSAVENARDALQAGQTASVESLHHISQLVWLFRCLPNDARFFKTLNQATMLGPPAIEANMLYRQANTWREQLVEVLISCGTSTCTDVVLNRLSALTEAAAVHIRDHSTLNPEEGLAQTMLFSRLWPKLSHLRELSDSAFDKILQLCNKVAGLPNKYICLNTLSNLWPHVYPQNETVYNTLRTINHDLLRLDDVDTENLDVVSINTRIMSALSMAVKLKAVEVLPDLIQISMKREILLPPVRAAALRTIMELLREVPQLTKSHKSQLRLQLMQKFLESNLNKIEDISFNTELFTTLAMLNLTTGELSHMLTTLRDQKRSELINVLHKIMLRLCKQKSLALNVCDCFERDKSCDRSVTHNWSLLATRSQSTFGQINSVYGDFLNLNNSLIIEYALHTTNGAGEELKHSKLEVNLLTADAETRLGQLSIHAHGLNTLAGIQSPNDEHNDTTWANIEFEALGTSQSPWPIFSGGVSELFGKLWSAPPEPSSIFSFIQPVIDRNQYTAFSSGWLLSINTFGIVGVDLSGALETSIWSQAGRSLVRTQLGLTCESYLHVIDEFVEDEEVVIQGFGVEARVDFINNIKIARLPAAVCMSMNHEDAKLWKWNSSRPISDFRPTGREHINTRELSNKADYQIIRKILYPGASYNLGDRNSERCNLLKSRNTW